MSFDPISAGLDFAGKVVDRIWPDATEQQKAEASARIAEMAHEEGLFKAEIDDRKSARERESQIVTSAEAPMLNKIVLPVIAISVVTLTFVLFGVLLVSESPIEPNRKDIIVFVCGALVGLASTVINYYFGSSSGSMQKTEAIEKMMRK